MTGEQQPAVEWLLRSAHWWQPPGSPRAVEAVDWGRGQRSEMITLNAMRILRAAGRARLHIAPLSCGRRA